MPTKSLRQCAVAGCPCLIPIGEIYCSTHRTANFKRFEYTRDKKVKRFYSTKGWENLRKMKLARNPICEVCYVQGKIVPAVIVHHKNPVSEGGKFLPPLNELESICASCHEKTHPKGAILEHKHAI